MGWIDIFPYCYVRNSYYDRELAEISDKYVSSSRVLQFPSDRIIFLVDITAQNKFDEMAI